MTKPIRIPEGIHQCADCGEYRGECRVRDLDWGLSEDELLGLPARYAEAVTALREAQRPDEDEVVRVSCLCQGIVCPICGKNRMHRPISNAYDPARNHVSHYPYFYGQRGCDECAARRAAEQAAWEAEREAERKEEERAERRAARRRRERRRAALLTTPDTPWPHVERPLERAGYTCRCDDELVRAALGLAREEEESEDDG